MKQFAYKSFHLLRLLLARAARSLRVLSQQCSESLAHERVMLHADPALPRVGPMRHHPRGKPHAPPSQQPRRPPTRLRLRLPPRPVSLRQVNPQLRVRGVVIGESLEQGQAQRGRGGGLLQALPLHKAHCTLAGHVLVVLARLRPHVLQHSIRVLLQQRLHREQAPHDRVERLKSQPSGALTADGEVSQHVHPLPRAGPIRLLQEEQLCPRLPPLEVSVLPVHAPPPCPALCQLLPQSDIVALTHSRLFAVLLQAPSSLLLPWGVWTTATQPLLPLPPRLL
eukprot:765498-Hanusia_phi.AAC.2